MDQHALKLMGSAYHWLVANGLWTGVIYAATGVITTAILGWIWLRIKGIHLGSLLSLVREHVHQQKRIADALDTSTPGGLADLVNTLQKEKP